MQKDTELFNRWHGSLNRSDEVGEGALDLEMRVVDDLERDSIRKAIVSFRPQVFAGPEMEEMVTLDREVEVEVSIIGEREERFGIFMEMKILGAEVEERSKAMEWLGQLNSDFRRYLQGLYPDHDPMELVDPFSHRLQAVSRQYGFDPSDYIREMREEYSGYSLSAINVAVSDDGGAMCLRLLGSTEGEYGALRRGYDDLMRANPEKLGSVDYVEWLQREMLSGGVESLARLYPLADAYFKGWGKDSTVDDLLKSETMTIRPGEEGYEDLINAIHGSGGTLRVNNPDIIRAFNEMGKPWEGPIYDLEGMDDEGFDVLSPPEPGKEPRLDFRVRDYGGVSVEWERDHRERAGSAEWMMLLARPLAHRTEIVDYLRSYEGTHIRDYSVDEQTGEIVINGRTMLLYPDPYADEQDIEEYTSIFREFEMRLSDNQGMTIMFEMDTGGRLRKKEYAQLRGVFANIMEHLQERIDEEDVTGEFRRMGFGRDDFRQSMEFAGTESVLEELVYKLSMRRFGEIVNRSGLEHTFQNIFPGIASIVGAYQGYVSRMIDELRGIERPVREVEDKVGDRRGFPHKSEIVDAIRERNHGAHINGIERSENGVLINGEVDTLEAYPYDAHLNRMFEIEATRNEGVTMWMWLRMNGEYLEDRHIAEIGSVFNHEVHVQPMILGSESRDRMLHMIENLGFDVREMAFLFEREEDGIFEEGPNVKFGVKMGNLMADTMPALEPEELYARLLTLGVDTVMFAQTLVNYYVSGY